MIKKRIALGVVLVLLTTSIAITSMYINKYDPVKTGYHWSIDTDVGTSVVEGMPFESIDKSFEGRDTNFYSREKFTIKSKYGSVRANIYGTDENFFSFNRYPLIRGSYFLKENIENYDRYIVIGKSVAKGLFKTTDIIGKEVEIATMKFSVIGVVEDEDLLPVNPFYETEKVAIISSDIFTNIFPNHNVIHGDVRSDKELEEKDIENMLSDEGLSVKELKISDSTKYQTRFLMNLRLVIFVVGGLFIVELLKRVFNEYKKLVERIKSFKKNYYMNQLQYLHEYGITKIIIKLTSMVIIIFIIYNAVSFKFFIDVYYDGTYDINSVGDALRWVLREFSIKQFEHSTSISETIKFLARVRTISLLLLVITYFQAYYETISWIKQKENN